MKELTVGKKYRMRNGCVVECTVVSRLSFNLVSNPNNAKNNSGDSQVFQKGYNFILVSDWNGKNDGYPVGGAFGKECDIVGEHYEAKVETKTQTKGGSMVNGKKYVLNNGIVVECVHANFGQVKVVSIPEDTDSNWEEGQTRSLKNVLGSDHQVASEYVEPKKEETAQDNIDEDMAKGAEEFAKIMSELLGIPVKGIGINMNTGRAFGFGSDN